MKEIFTAVYDTLNYWHGAFVEVIRQISIIFFFGFISEELLVKIFMMDGEKNSWRQV